VVAALVQLASAFVATVALYEQVAALPALFGTGACTASSLACAEARAARRLALVNGSPAAAWFAGLGTLVLAFAPTLRPGVRGAPTDDITLALGRTSALLAATGAAVACIWSVATYCTFEGEHAAFEWATVAGILGAFLTPFFDTSSGSLIFLLALVIDQALMLADTAYGGPRVLHPTFAALLVTGGALGLHFLGTWLIDAAWTWLPQRRLDALKGTVGVLAIAGTSVAVLMYCSAATALAAASGALPPDSWLRGGGEARHARSLAAFAVVHFLPAVVWLGCVATRDEADSLSAPTRVWTWILTGVAVPALWGVLRWLAGGEDDALNDTIHRLVDEGPFWVGAGLCTIVPWLALAFA
jgi:hypothetical protein